MVIVNGKIYSWTDIDMIKKNQLKVLFEALNVGLTITESCKISGISRQGFYKRCKEDKEFSKKVQIAPIKIKKSHLKNLHDKSHLTWQISGWWLERKFPEEYALKLKHEIQIKFVSELLTEIMKALRRIPHACLACNTKMGIREDVAKYLMTLSDKFNVEKIINQ